MDRIDTMKAFVAVAEAGSFTKAGEKLELSNQLVSKYVSQLEEQLGVRLFNRTTRNVRLTQEGEQCLQHALHILESVDDMENHFGQLQAAAKGQLHISAPVSFATQYLGPLVRDFKKAYPDVGVNLELSDRKVDVVEEGFDVALRIGHLKDSSLIAKRVAPVRLVLCAAPSYLDQHGVPEHPEDLIGSHFLRYSYMEYAPLSNPLMKVLRAHSQNNPNGIIANNGDILVSAAVAGEGYILQPTFIVSEPLKSGQLSIILKDYEPEPMGLYAVYPHRKLLAPKLRAFIDFMSSYFGDPPYWDQF
ncbi:LysR family transcriptional regulator [Reinekea blandensis]|uniref:Probable transcriptional regulator, LysR family protein n=1 Tax=Reinekea blandensis MED297 TaxID=314283 RepID=A4BKI9_9GAMM|nr:LysR family transcriptional regulator [Reinekea blandensis]EAR07342.1 probable transcriptional regulator, LysR family protein [Reinekea sp. MED297] [Reinekea blandensis MED297]